MLFLTTKLDLKKILIAVIALAAILILAFRILKPGDAPSQTTASTSISSNDDRLEFLKNCGWEVESTPKESGQVRIPEESSAVYDQYNKLQKSQGYDLSNFAGKTVMRYVYTIKGDSAGSDPKYATLLIYKNCVIGGDVTDTAAKGTILPLMKPSARSSSD